MGIAVARAKAADAAAVAAEKRNKQTKIPLKSVDLRGILDTDM